MRRLVLFSLFLLGAAAGLAADAAPAADTAKLFFSKSWPAATPAYIEIRLDRNGKGEYREAPNDEHPLSIQLAQQDIDQVFALAERLGNFTRPLESGLKVAKTGVKTFRYENGAEKHEVQFNYSLDENARELLDWFERITESEQHLINLERTARFDKLGVDKALLQLEVSRDRKRLISTQQFLPILDRIAKNETYIHMARARAASLAEDFRKIDTTKPADGQQ